MEYSRTSGSTYLMRPFLAWTLLAILVALILAADVFMVAFASNPWWNIDAGHLAAILGPVITVVAAATVILFYKWGYADPKPKHPAHLVESERDGSED